MQSRAPWAIFSREPNVHMIERECASEFCRCVEVRLYEEVAVDDLLVKRLRAYTARVDQKFPEKFLH